MNAQPCTVSEDIQVGRQPVSEALKTQVKVRLQVVTQGVCEQRSPGPHLGGGGGLRRYRLLRNAPPPQRLRCPLLSAHHWPQRSPIQPPGREGGVASRCRAGGGFCRAARCGAGFRTMEPGSRRGECGCGPSQAPGRPPGDVGRDSEGAALGLRTCPGPSRPQVAPHPLCASFIPLAPVPRAAWPAPGSCGPRAPRLRLLPAWSTAQLPGLNIFPPSCFGTSQHMPIFPVGLASLQWRAEFLIIEKLCDRPGIKGNLSSS